MKTDRSRTQGEKGGNPLQVTTKDLRPDMWPQVESLFGLNRACGGCWCQAWRIEKGEKWVDIKGATAKERLRQGVMGGQVFAIIAFVEDKPVGWCTYGPRVTFPRLNRSPSFKCEDAEQVWSLPCFFVARGYRGKGIARAMLEHALRTMENRGVKIAEGYPSKPGKDGRYIDAFSWAGTRSLFEKAGFTVAGNPDGGKQHVRKILPHSS